MRFSIWIVILTFFLFGCSVPKSPYKSEPTLVERDGVSFTSVANIDSKLWVHFPENTSVFKKNLLLDACKKQLVAFEEDWGKSTRPCSVFLFDSPEVACPSNKGKFAGCHYGPSGPIHVIMDKYCAASVLYHELIHHNLVERDNKHSSPKWKEKWNDAQASIWKSIVRSHFWYIR